MLKPDIYKVKTINKGFLSVMAKPASGDWIEDEFNGIVNEGINLVVSLLEFHEAYELGLKNEKDLAIANEMDFISFPIKDRGLPSSIREYLAFTKELYQQITNGKNTVIHCRAGIGRTGMVAAGILLHCGFNPGEAISLISSKRGIQVPDTEDQLAWVESSYNELLRYR